MAVKNLSDEVEDIRVKKKLEDQKRRLKWKRAD
jgi:hypothetical protein